MEYRIWKADAIGLSRTSYKILIRENTDVRLAEVLLENRADADAYITANLSDLYAAGSTPPAAVNPLAVFYAVETAAMRPLFLGVIFAAFNQMKIGGSMAEMITAARNAFAQDDDALAAFNSFEVMYKGATTDEQQTLNAMAIWVALNMIASDQ